MDASAVRASLFLSKYRARYSVGLGGRSLFSACRPSMSVGSTVWSRYWRTGSADSWCFSMPSTLLCTISYQECEGGLMDTSICRLISTISALTAGELTDSSEADFDAAGESRDVGVGSGASLSSILFYYIFQAPIHPSKLFCCIIAIRSGRS